MIHVGVLQSFTAAFQFFFFSEPEFRCAITKQRGAQDTDSTDSTDPPALLANPNARRYHKHPKDAAGFVEQISPHLAIILPARVVREHAELERSLFTNMQRYITHFDLHKTIKGLMHLPRYEQRWAASGERGFFAPSPGEAPGSLSHHTAVRGVHSINLADAVVPANRGCADAGIPALTCLCSPWDDVEVAAYEELRIAPLAATLVAHLNARVRNALPPGAAPSACRTLTLGRVLHVDAKLDLSGSYDIFMVQFTTPEGPATWDGFVTAKGVVHHVEQTSRYRKYEACWDERVSLAVCICKQFPPGTP